MSVILIEGILLGLAVGPMCLVYCSPVLVPFITSTGFSKTSISLRILILFLSGRLAGYLIIGLFVGLAGMQVEYFSSLKIIGITSILQGAILLIFGIQKNFPEWGLCRFINFRNSTGFYSILLGLITGISICPPFIAAIIGAGATQNISDSLLYFFAFYIGTVIYFPVMLLFNLFSKAALIKTIAQILLVISGVYFLINGFINLIF